MGEERTMSGHSAAEIRVQRTYLAFALANTSPESGSPAEVLPNGAAEVKTSHGVEFPATGEAWLDTHVSVFPLNSDDPAIRLVVRAVVAVPEVEGEVPDDLRSRVEAVAERPCLQKALDELQHLMAAMSIGVPDLSIDGPPAGEDN